MLGDRNIKLKVPCCKLGPKRIGPYRLVKKVGLAAYSMESPTTVSFYPVFHESLLSHYQFPPSGEPQAILVEDSTNNKVEAVLSSRFYKRQLQYLVAQKGYSEVEYSWLSEKQYSHFQDLIDEYHRTFPKATGPTKPKASQPLTLAPMNLPKGHRKFSISSMYSGVSPLTKDEGDVRT